MKIKCTPQELKELLKKEQTECKSECSNDDLKYLQNKAKEDIIVHFSSNHRHE